MITTSETARHLLQDQIQALRDQDAKAEKDLKASQRRIERIQEKRQGLAQAIVEMTKALDSLGGPIEEEGQK